MVHEEVLAVRQKLRDAEDRAYDRFLSASAVLAEALREIRDWPKRQGVAMRAICDLLAA